MDFKFQVGEEVFVKPFKKLGKVVKVIDLPSQNKHEVVVHVAMDGYEIERSFHFADIKKLPKRKEKIVAKKEVTRKYRVPVQLSSGSKGLTEIEVGDWVDLSANETVVLRQFDYHELDLGIAMKVPKGYEAHLKPRSSTFKKFGVIQTNGTGIIDNSYSGKDDIWKMPILAMRQTVIEKGERICQFRFVKKMDKEQFEFFGVDELRGANRGGFGSTGTK